MANDPADSIHYKKASNAQCTDWKQLLKKKEVQIKLNFVGSFDPQILWKYLFKCF